MTLGVVGLGVLSARSTRDRDFVQERFQRWGHWMQPAPAGDPLHAHAPHFRPVGSRLISEPYAAGGCGLAAEHMLLGAGVVAVGHMCRTLHADDGAATHEWIESYRAARRRHPRLPDFGAAEKAWARQLERLRAAGIPPCAAADTRGQGSLSRCIKRGRNAEVAAVEASESAACEATAAVLRALDEPDVRARRSREVWQRALRRCVPGVQQRAARAWHHGGRDRDIAAAGARGLGYGVVEPVRDGGMRRGRAECYGP